MRCTDTWTPLQLSARKGHAICGAQVAAAYLAALGDVAIVLLAGVVVLGGLLTPLVLGPVLALFLVALVDCA